MNVRCYNCMLKDGCSLKQFNKREDCWRRINISLPLETKRRMMRALYSMLIEPVIGGIKHV